MKPRKSRILALILLAVIVGGAIWLFFAKPDYVTTASYTVTPAAKADAPKTVTQATPVAQVESPKAAAVTANGGKVDSPAEDAALAQAELKAVFLNIGRLLRAGDYATFRETYFLDESPAGIQRAREDQIRGAAARAARDPDDPDVRWVQQLHIAGAQSYEALANQTPTFNSAGDEATYQYIDPDYYGTGTYTGVGEPTPLTFIRIDGRWYVKPVNYKKPDSQGK